MKTLSYLGAVLTAFGPTCLLLAVWIGRRPILAVITLGAAFWCLIPQVFIGIVYVIARAVVKSDMSLDDGEDDTPIGRLKIADTLMKNTGAAVSILLFTWIFQNIARVGLCKILLLADQYFRRHGQLVHHAFTRSLPMGLAAGFGFGGVYAGSTGLALFLGIDESIDPISNNDGITYYSESCSSLPFHFWQALFLLAAQITQTCWTGLFMVGLTAFTYPNGSSGIRGQSEREQGLLLFGFGKRNHDDGVQNTQFAPKVGEDGEVSFVDAKKVKKRTRLNAAAALNQIVNEKEEAEDDREKQKQQAEALADLPSENDSVAVKRARERALKARLPRPSGNIKAKGLIYLILPWLLHATFIFVSLAHDCRVSLAVQYVVVLLSVVLVFEAAVTDREVTEENWAEVRKDTFPGTPMESSPRGGLDDPNSVDL